MPLVPINKIIIEERAREELGEDFEELKTSIKNRGLFHPIILNKKDYTLTSGFRRYTACKELGFDKIEAKFFEDLSPLEKKIIELEENIHAPLTWDEQAKLRSQIHAYQQELHGITEPSKGGRPSGYSEKGWSIQDTAESLGISEATLVQDLKLANAIETVPTIKKLTSRRQALRAIDRAEEVAILTELARRDAEGDVKTDEQSFRSSPYILIHGDAVKHLKEKIEDEVIDLVIFDPPWGVDIHSKADSRGPKGEKTSYKDDTETTAINLTVDLLPEIHRIMKPDAHMYMFIGVQHRDYYYDLLTNYALFIRRIQVWKLMFPQMKQLLNLMEEEIEKVRAERSWSFYVEEVPLIWVKEGGGYTDFEHKFMPRYEAILFCSKGMKKTFNEPISNVFEYKRPATTERIHTQEKPVDLIQKFIKISTQQNEIVLDPCAGSFSTAVAATLSGRRSICIDNDEVCYAKGLQRIQGFLETDNNEENFRHDGE